MICTGVNGAWGAHGACVSGVPMVPGVPVVSYSYKYLDLGLPFLARLLGLVG